MFALRLFGYVFIAFVVALLVTQMFIPMLMGTRLFPMFRKTRLHIQDEIAEVKEQLTDQQLQEELDRLKAELHKGDHTDVNAKVDEAKVESEVK